MDVKRRERTCAEREGFWGKEGKEGQEERERESSAEGKGAILKVLHAPSRIEECFLC